MNQATLNKAVIASFIAISAISFGHLDAGGLSLLSANAAESVKASKLGDLTPFRKIATDTKALVDKGDLVGGGRMQAVPRRSSGDHGQDERQGLTLRSMRAT